MKPKRCLWCKKIIHVWQRERDGMHDGCAQDVRYIWREDQKRGGA